MTNQPEEAPTLVDGKVDVAPVARLHLGGDAFWEAPLAETTSYYQVKSVSRTWGYVMKAHATSKMVEHFERMNAGINSAIDIQMSGYAFVRKFPVLAPKIPLLTSVGEDSATSHASLQGLNREVIEIKPDVWKTICWHATYVKGQPCQQDVN